jgi:hypothetical protein
MVTSHELLLALVGGIVRKMASLPAYKFVELDEIEHLSGAPVSCLNP